MNQGTLTKAVGSYHRMRMTWTQTQNPSANSSTITTRLYWEATQAGAGTVSSSASKTATTTVGGIARSDNFTAGLSAGQSKLIQTETFTVPHNADGTKTIALAFSATLGLTLSGAYVGTVSQSASATLDPIATSSVGRLLDSFRVPENPRFGITASNPNYRHSIDLILSYGNNSETVATRTGLAAGTHTLNLVSSENEKIVNFCRYNQTYFSAVAKLRVRTYNGSTLIGTYLQENYTEARTPDATVAQIMNTDEIKMDTVLQISLESRASDTLCHWLELATSPTFDNGRFFRANLGASVANTTINLALFREHISNAIGADGTAVIYLRTHTFYNVSDGIEPNRNKIRTMEATPFVVVASDPPVWGEEHLSYKDVSATVGITGSDQILVRTKSTARIFFPLGSLATSTDGTIQSYTFSLGNFTQTWAAAQMPSYVDVPITSLYSNTTGVLTARDSMGQASTKSIALTIFDYSAPTITSLTATREGAQVNLVANGRHNPINGGNTIVLVKYGDVPMAHSFNNNGVWTASAQLTVSEEEEATIQVEATDRFGTTVRGSVLVPKEKPLMFIDALGNRVGIGKEPTQGALDVEGTIHALEFGRIRSKTGSHAFEVSSVQTVPVLTLKGYQDTATLLIDSARNDYSSRLGFAKQGTETAYIERNYLTDALIINSNRTMELAATEGINVLSSTIFQEGLETRGSIDMGNDVAALGFYSNVNQQVFAQVGTVSITMKATERASFVDITFPKVFPNGIVGVIAQPINSQSNTYKSSVFNQTRSGCRIYSTHIDDVKAANTMTMMYFAIGY